MVHRLDLEAQRRTLHPGYRLAAAAVKQVENVLARLKLAGKLQFPIRRREIAFERKTLLRMKGNQKSAAANRTWHFGRFEVVNDDSNRMVAL